MTDDEWESVALVIDKCWRGDFDDEMAQAYRVMLSTFTGEQVIVALRKLAEGGTPWVPSLPEIVKAIRDSEEEQVPGWREVWRALRAAMRCRDEEAAYALLNDVHPVAARFMTACGGWAEMRRTPFDDPDYGGVRVRELREDWTEFVEVARERIRRGRALDAGEPRPQVGPRRLDMHALVDTLRPHRQLPSGDE